VGSTTRCAGCAPFQRIRLITGPLSFFLNSTSRVCSLVWKCALVFVAVRRRFFLGCQGKGRDPGVRREVRFRNTLNLACHTNRSKTLWLMSSKRKPGPREAAIRRACSWTTLSVRIALLRASENSFTPMGFSDRCRCAKIKITEPSERNLPPIRSLLMGVS
jgi:hypothetical protein